MKHKQMLFTILFVFITLELTAQHPTSTWDKWKFLTGKWVGEGNGQPGQGSGYFTFNAELDGNILVRKGHTEFPATNGRPAAVHDDLMIIYLDYTGKPSKAIYFDNENHVINYSVSANDSDSSIVFLSEQIANVPRFRLSYIPIDSKTVNVKFEMALPQKPEEFKTYIEGKSIKK